MQELFLPQDPQEVYQNDNTTRNNPLPEEIISYIATKIEWTPMQGRLNFIQGATYPQKSAATPEAVHSIGLLKKTLKFYLKSPIFFLLTPKQHLLTHFNEIAMHQERQALSASRNFFIKEMFLTPSTRAVQAFIHSFLTKTTSISNETISLFAYVFAHLIEYDDAYRYRLQDILSETTYRALQTNPRKEIKRLLQILQERTPKDNGTDKKIALLIRPLLLLLLIPKYKKAFTCSLTPEILQGLQYDEADRYWACLKGDDYLFTGYNYETRTKGLQIPQAVRVNY